MLLALCIIVKCCGNGYRFSIISAQKWLMNCVFPRTNASLIFVNVPGSMALNCNLYMIVRKIQLNICPSNEHLSVNGDNDEFTMISGVITFNN